MTSKRTQGLGGLAAGALLVFAGCQDLTVPNPNNPDIDRILQDPVDVESLVGSSWRPYWNYTQGGGGLIDASLAVSAMGDEMTATFTNVGVLDLGSEPRTPFNNDPAYAARFANQGPWYAWYGGINNANVGLQFVNGIGRPASRVVVGGVDRTARTRAFAKFVQGLLHGYYAMYYDRAYIVSETYDMEDPEVIRGLQLKPYAVVRDTAVAMLREAARLAAADTFTLPLTWINGLTIRNTDLARLANTYAARTLAYSARTPTERAAVNWDEVIRLIDAGITADHAPIGEINILNSNYKRFTQQTVNTAAGIRSCDGGTTIQMRIDTRIVGPADTTGQYQAWLAKPVAQRTRFTLRTPDRRIEGAAAPVGGIPSNGSYFRYCTGDGQFVAGRGTYHFSAYQWNRLNTRWREGALPIVTRTEMDLLKAEGLLRKGDAAGAAALINRSRVANGQLPPLAASGVPQSRGCVPRTATGACGSLWDALYYEKGIEGAGVESYVRWFDGRGWGLLPKGTPLHFPVPGRELAAIDEPFYTTGGDNPGSAP